MLRTCRIICVSACCITALIHTQHTQAAIRFRVRILLTPKGLDQAEARGVNNSGVVVGQASQPNHCSFRGLAWFDPGQEPAVIIGPGADVCIATAINDDNVVVGNIGEGTAGFRWTLGSDLVPLDNLTDCCSNATGINNADVIVGDSSVLSGAHRAVRWINEGIHELGAIDDDCCSSAADISNTGIIVGESNARATRWVNGFAESLGTPGQVSLGQSVNDAGNVVGYSVDPSTIATPFVWRGSMQPLPLLEPAMVGYAYAINNHELIAGLCAGANGFASATIWQHDQPIDVNERLVDAPANVRVFQARDISDAGYVAANGVVGDDAAVMRLDPVPPFDVLPNGIVNIDDLVAVIHAWGVCAPSSLCAADINDDGSVNINDLVLLIVHWGPVS